MGVQRRIDDREGVGLSGGIDGSGKGSYIEVAVGPLPFKGTILGRWGIHGKKGICIFLHWEAQEIRSTRNLASKAALASFFFHHCYYCSAMGIGARKRTT